MTFGMTFNGFDLVVQEGDTAYCVAIASGAGEEARPIGSWSKDSAPSVEALIWKLDEAMYG